MSADPRDEALRRRIAAAVDRDEALRRRIAAAVERHGLAAVAARLGLTQESTARLALGQPVRHGTAVAALAAMPKVEA